MVKKQNCHMDTDSFIVYIKTNNICIYITEDVVRRFDTSNYELDRPLPKGKNEKVVGLINKRWIRWKNHDKTFWIKCKNL